MPIIIYSYKNASSFVLLSRFIYILTLFSCINLNAQLQFSEEALSMGINHIYPSGQSGGGVSFVDFNNDGLDDLTLGTSAGDQIHFYINTGNGFQRSGPLINNTEEHKQILWADYDNDGDQDLFVCSKNGVNRFYQNNGELQFVDITEDAGFPMDEYYTFNACWADFNRDGWLDLYVCERIPLNTDLNRNYLFINNADGTFNEVAIDHNATAPGKLPFSSSAFDFNNDNWPDIYIANDRKWGNTLLKNIGDAMFEDVSIQSMTDLKMDGMSIALADVDQDGYSDFYVSNISDGNKFFLNQQDETFIESASKYGIEFKGTAWGSNFLDADNDGDSDLYVSGSDIGTSIKSSALYEYVKPDSTFIENAGLELDTVSSYANATGDFNADGYPDIFVVNRTARSFLLANQNFGNNYLKINLLGVLSNRDGIGSKLELYANNLYQSYYTHSGIGFLGQNSKDVIFGLGSLTEFDSLVVTWSSGHIDILKEAPINNKIVLEEGFSTEGEINVAEDVTITNGNFLNSYDKINSTDSDIIISPNPFSTSFEIQGNTQNIKNIRIYDLQGRLIKREQITKNGQYLVVITMKNGKVIVRKLIKFS